MDERRREDAPPKPPLPYEGQIEELVYDLEQLRVVASVAADEVFNTLDPLEPRSIRQVAEEIGRAPASVGEQMAKLVAAGLVLPAATRRSGARTETLYVHRARTNRVAFRDQSPEHIRLHVARFRGKQNQTERQYEEFLKTVQTDPSHSAFGRTLRGTFHFDRDGAARFRAAMEELYHLANELDQTDPAERTEEHVRIRFTGYLLPTVRESRRRRK